MKLSTFTHESTRGWSSDFPSQQYDESLILVFGSPAYSANQEVIEDLCDTYPNSYIIGCSTAGEIYDSFASDNSLSVALLQFEHTKLRVSYANIIRSGSSFKAGSTLASELMAPDLRGLFVLSDGTNVNGSELIEGINAHLPAHIPVTGGLAGDGPNFNRTWILHHGMVSSDIIVAVGFYGDHIQIGHGSQGGWDIFGPERLITKSDGPVLYELDGKPALELYKTYLGERADELPAAALLFPLAIRENDSTNKQIVRTILSINEETQSMTFAGNIPEGARAQLMKANFDRLIDGAMEAANKIDVGAEREGDLLAIAISCVGRRLVLGERTDEELEATIEALPAGAKQIGFYSYGELSPYGSGKCDLHNQTMTLTTISEG